MRMVGALACAYESVNGPNRCLARLNAPKIGPRSRQGPGLVQRAIFSAEALTNRQRQIASVAVRAPLRGSNTLSCGGVSRQPRGFRFLHAVQFLPRRWRVAADTVVFQRLIRFSRRASRRVMPQFSLIARKGRGCGLDKLHAEAPRPQVAPELLAEQRLHVGFVDPGWVVGLRQSVA
jgi:hypothetical protein